MIVQRPNLAFLDRLYIPSAWNGFKVTLRHFLAKKVTMQYPERRWRVPPGYRGAPYLVRDQTGRVKCVACQLCEFICPPRAIRVTPPGPEFDPTTGNVEKRPRQFHINMLRCIFCGFCEEVCPEEAIFLMTDYSLSASTRTEMVYDLDLLLARGGTQHDQIRKWEHARREAETQTEFPPQCTP